MRANRRKTGAWKIPAVGEDDKYGRLPLERSEFDEAAAETEDGEISVVAVEVEAVKEA
jgi:hypothetical protein